MAPIRSKRKNQGSNYPFKRQKDGNNGNGILRRIIPAPTVREVSKALLQQCFGVLKEGIWWRVLPLDDMYDDMIRYWHRLAIPIAATYILGSVVRQDHEV